MKHVVFVVGSYYPVYSAVGKCIGNIVREFEKEYKVTVICEKNVAGQSNREMLGKHRIVRVTTKARYSRIKIEKKMKEANGIEKTLFKMLLLMLKVERFLKVALSKTACDYKMIEAYVNALDGIEEKVDIVVPTCVPFESVMAALEFKKRNSQVDVVPYLFDLYSDNINVNRGKVLKNMHWNANLRIEKKMFEEAKVVFHVRNWTKHIEKNFPDYKEKSFEIEHPLLVLEDDFSRLPENEISIQVNYLNNDDIPTSDFERILEMVTKLRMQNTSICLYGFEKRGGEEDYSWCDAIVVREEGTSIEKKQVLTRADVLLVIGDVDDTRILAEILEYVVTGKKVIHFVKNKEMSSPDLLRNYLSAKIVDMSSEMDFDILKTFIQKDRKKRAEIDEDIDLLESIYSKDISNIISFVSQSREYKLIYAGALKKGYVEAQYVVDLFSGDLLKDCRLHFYSAGNGVDIVKRARKENFIVSDWIDKKQLDEEYKKADAFISIAERSGNNISSKIFEYMSTGKPIIHIYYTDNDKNIQYLDKYKKSICIKAEDTELFHNRLKTILFLLRTVNSVKERLDDKLMECTPEYISKMIQKKFIG